MNLVKLFQDNKTKPDFHSSVVREFFTALSVCHTVIPQYEEEQSNSNSSSSSNSNSSSSYESITSGEKKKEKKENGKKDSKQRRDKMRELDGIEEGVDDKGEDQENISNKRGTINDKCLEE